jgi:hypothetical protein
LIKEEKGVVEALGYPSAIGASSIGKRFFLHFLIAQDHHWIFSIDRKMSTSSSIQYEKLFLAGLVALMAISFIKQNEKRNKTKKSWDFSSLWSIFVKPTASSTPKSIETSDKPKTAPKENSKMITSPKLSKEADHVLNGKLLDG